MTTVPFFVILQSFFQSSGVGTGITAKNVLGALEIALKPRALTMQTLLSAQLPSRYEMFFRDASIHDPALGSEVNALIRARYEYVLQQDSIQLCAKMTFRENELARVLVDVMVRGGLIAAIQQEAPPPLQA
jgi:hypothetical protein